MVAEHPSGDAPLVYAPAQACERLGVSPSTLRRMVATFERVFAPLPRGGDNGRFYTQEVIERLGAAHALRKEGAAASFELALRALAQGDGRSVAQAPAQVNPDVQVQELCAEVRALTQALTELSGEIRVQNERIRELESGRPPKRAAWWRFWERSA